MIFSTDPLTPDLDKINPLAGIKRLFSRRQVIEGLRLIFKMTVVVAGVLRLVKSEILNSPAQLGSEPAGMLSRLRGRGQGDFPESDRIRARAVRGAGLGPDPARVPDELEDDQAGSQSRNTRSVKGIRRSRPASAPCSARWPASA